MKKISFLTLGLMTCAFGMEPPRQQFKKEPSSILSLLPLRKVSQNPKISDQKPRLIQSQEVILHNHGDRCFNDDGYRLNSGTVKKNNGFKRANIHMPFGLLFRSPLFKNLQLSIVHGRNQKAVSRDIEKILKFLSASGKKCELANLSIEQERDNYTPRIIRDSSWPYFLRLPFTFNLKIENLKGFDSWAKSSSFLFGGTVPHLILDYPQDKLVPLGIKGVQSLTLHMRGKGEYPSGPKSIVPFPRYILDKSAFNSLHFLTFVVHNRSDDFYKSIKANRSLKENPRFVNFSFNIENLHQLLSLKELTLKGLVLKNTFGSAELILADPKAIFKEIGLLKLPKSLTKLVIDFPFFWKSDAEIDQNLKKLARVLQIVPDKQTRKSSSKNSQNQGALNPLKVVFRKSNLRPEKEAEAKKNYPKLSFEN